MIDDHDTGRWVIACISLEVCGRFFQGSRGERFLRVYATPITRPVEYTTLLDTTCTTGPDVRVSVPLEALGAAEGATLTGLEVSAALGGAAPGALEVFDEMALPDTTVPVSRVELGVAPPAASQAEVDYTRQADLVAGRFSGTFDASSLPQGDQRLWARACLGKTCAAHQAIQLQRACISEFLGGFSSALSPLLLVSGQAIAVSAESSSVSGRVTAVHWLSAELAGRRGSAPDGYEGTADAGHPQRHDEGPSSRPAAEAGAGELSAE